MAIVAIARSWRSAARQRAADRRFAARNAVTRVLADASTIAISGPRILEAICETLAWDAGELWTIDPSAELRRSHHWARAATDDDARLRELAVRAATSELPIWIGDADTSAVALRVPRRDGQLGGVLTLRAESSRPFDQAVLDTLAAIASQVGQFIAHKHESEELDLFFTLSPDLLCVTSHTGYFQRLNPAWEATLGWTREELMARPYIEFVHPEDVARTTAEHERLLNNGCHSYAFENRYRCKTGAYKWFQWASTTSPDGSVLYGLARDLTESKRAELELREAHRFLDSVVENLPNMVFVKDAETLQFVELNKAGEQLLGIKRDELLGTNDFDSFPAEQAAFYQATDREVLRGGKLIEVAEERVQTRSHGERLLRTKKIPIVGSDGRPSYLLGISEDITERRRTETELEALARKNQLILTSIGEGIYGIDSKGRATFVNPAAAQMLGWSVDELIGQPMHKLVHHTRVNGKPYTAEDCPIYAACHDGTVHRVADEVFWRKDGTCFPVEYVSTPIAGTGTSMGAVVAFRDISARLAVDRMKDEFISVASHELRTPLTSIRGALNVVASGQLGELPPKSRRMIDIAMQSTNRLMRLTNQMLDLERLRESPMVPIAERCDAAVLVEESVNDMRGLAQQLEIELSHSAAPLVVCAAADQIVQTLTNLLSNAMKFSSAGTTVHVNVERHGEAALFAVTDQGRGIPADKLELVFERFQQLEYSDSRDRGGSGLGLAICRSIVTRHGGQIWVESTPGQGSTFYFTIPLGSKAAAPASAGARA
ncbi:MAG: PAS domain S-box protein [Kofleriaceae bacterium]